MQDQLTDATVARFPLAMQYLAYYTARERWQANPDAWPERSLCEDVAVYEHAEAMFDVMAGARWRVLGLHWSTFALEHVRYEQ